MELRINNFMEFYLLEVTAESRVEPPNPESDAVPDKQDNKLLR